MTSTGEEKIWANSGDSHLVEPSDLFSANLPSELAERMPRSVKDPDGEFETIGMSAARPCRSSTSTMP